MEEKINEELLETVIINEKKGHPYRCPVCNGSGLVSTRFYEPYYSPINEQTATIPEYHVTCRSCKGMGIIWGD